LSIAKKSDLPSALQRGQCATISYLAPQAAVRIRVAKIPLTVPPPTDPWYTTQRCIRLTAWAFCALKAFEMNGIAVN
jgi:hypothetical protein